MAFIVRYLSGKLPKTSPFTPWIRFKSEEGKFRKTYIRVTILGANTRLGEALAFQLKQNPLVSQIHLYGTTKVLSIAADLQHIDTRSQAHGYYGVEGLPKAIRRSDVILMMAAQPSNSNASMEERLRTEAPRVAELAEACAKYAPKSILAVCVPPVSGTLPLVTEIYKKYNWYHPARVIGSVAHSQVRVNTMAAKAQNLDAGCVYVPLTGGPDCCCVVPMFSRATPIGLLHRDCEQLMRGIRANRDPKDNEIRVTTCRCDAYAINRMVTAIGLGLLGQRDGAICNAFVRQNILSTTKYLVCTVRFGKNGIVHNYGLPRLTKFEMTMLEKVTDLLRSRQAEMKRMVEHLERDPNSAMYAMKNHQPYSDIAPVRERGASCY